MATKPRPPAGEEANRLPPADIDEPPSGAKKWAWFIGLCLAGLLTTAGLAYALRSLLFLAT